MNIIRKILIIISVIMITYPSYSQLGNVILLKGKVDDISSGAPLGVKIYLTTADGKKIVSNSNSSDGTYQAVVNSGETYNVIIEDYFIINGEKILTIPKHNGYTEIYKHFSCQKITSGLELFEHKVFSANHSEIIEQEFSSIGLIKEMLKSNPKMNIKVIVTSVDSWFNPKKVKVPDPKSKKKKATKTVTISTEEQLRELLEARKESVRSFLVKHGIRDKRFEIEDELILNKPPPSKSKKGKKPTHTAKHNNMRIVVGKMLKF